METIGEMDNGRMTDEDIDRAYLLLMQRFNLLKEQQDTLSKNIDKAHELSEAIESGSKDFTDEFLKTNNITNVAELNEYIADLEKKQKTLLERMEGINSDISKYMQEVVKAHPYTRRILPDIVDKKYREKILKYKTRAEGRTEALSFCEKIQAKIDDPKVGDVVESTLQQLIYQSKYDRIGRDGTTTHSEEYSDALEKLWKYCPQIKTSEIMRFLEYGKARKTSYINKGMQDSAKKIDIKEMIKVATKINKGQKKSLDNTVTDMERALSNVSIKLKRLLDNRDQGNYGSDLDYWKKAEQKGTIQNKMQLDAEKMLSEAKKQAKEERVTAEKERAAREKERKKSKPVIAIPPRTNPEAQWKDLDEDDREEDEEYDDDYDMTLGEKIKAWFRRIATRIGFGRKRLPPGRRASYYQDEDDYEDEVEEQPEEMQIDPEQPLPGGTREEIAANLQIEMDRNKKKIGETQSVESVSEASEASTEELETDESLDDIEEQDKSGR